MAEYEFVSKKEYGSVRKELEEIINRVQRIMERDYDTSFRYQLIGSGSRHLITRVKGGNKGFDLDYNLILEPLEDGYYVPKVIAEDFMNAFNKAIKGTSYNQAPQHRTSVIRLRKVDRNKKKVHYGCDFAIVYYLGDYSDGYKYLKHWDDGHYTFEQRKLSKNADWKLEEILEYENGWNWIREEYLKLKCRNRDRNKHSYVLYLESIHNVYNQIMQENSEEEKTSGNSRQCFNCNGIMSLGKAPNYNNVCFKRVWIVAD